MDGILSPRWGWTVSRFPFHGLRRGLRSGTASRLGLACDIGCKYICLISFAGFKRPFDRWHYSRYALTGN